MNNLISLYEDSDIFIQAEKVEDIVVIHTTVKRFSHNRMRKFLAVWSAIAYEMHKQGITEIYAPVMGTEKQLKWIENFGFKPCGMELRYTNGMKREAYKWDCKLE